MSNRQGIYPNIKVSEVDYGFGWVIDGDMSTQTIDGILTKLDLKFLYLKQLTEKLEQENKMMRECLEKAIGCYEDLQKEREVLNKLKESEK